MAKDSSHNQIDGGVLTFARFVPSPNCNDRPSDGPVDLLIVHGISLPPREFGGDCIEKLFTNQLPRDAHPYFETIRGMEVSSHVLIRRTGEVVQFVPFHRRAWHAGQSCFGDKADCNNYSIGVELEGCDDMPYKEKQYVALVAVTKAIMGAYPAIDVDRIVGHSDVAPGRKTDPGPAFDWTRFRFLLRR